MGKIEAIKGEARLPGEVGGPAIRFTVTIENSTDSVASLKSAVVNVYYGRALTPAGELEAPGAVPLPSEVAAGGQAKGTSIFTVPDDARDDVTITFDLGVGAPLIAFKGSVPR